MKECDYIMLSIEEKKYWIWISRLPRVGSKTIRKLLDKYDILENIYKLSKEELVANGISQKLALFRYEGKVSRQKMFIYWDN